ncbi:hypothetical protein MPOCJGCO_3558 [Methylobacterium trifolii]|uniref:Secreted protein n=1 Tax=Methylobacterium trifolii TaxID=1003092 RepID=A0ABQ4U2D7_9HYPH|nr:hypothetical protein MPOCJGCO_3558 [Methylobacterium trifolii]
MPFWASTFCCAMRKAAWAASRFGLLASASATRRFSAFERNRVHHWPGMSAPETKLWSAEPPCLVAMASAALGSFSRSFV